DYVAVRFEGIISLYRAHLLAAEDPAQAERDFRRALAALASAKALFRDLKGYHMSALRELEPTVPYTAAFLKDWETRGYWEPRSRWFHVVWERLDEFEQIVRGLRPNGLAAEEPGRAESTVKLHGSVVDAATGRAIPSRVYIRREEGAWFFPTVADKPG